MCVRALVVAQLAQQLRHKRAVAPRRLLARRLLGAEQPHPARPVVQQAHQRHPHQPTAGVPDQHVPVQQLDDRLCDLFGMTVHTAERFVAAIEHPDLADDTR
jgi:hypothetical protein